MRVLAACEFSGRVRDAFIARGHDAVSCDLEPSLSPGPHIQDDVRRHLEGWDLIIAFPPCKYLCASGASWHYGSPRMGEAIGFVRELANAPCERIAIENPIGALSTHWRKPDQYIQPWEYGHGETKRTCLWLKNLPRLMPTDVVNGRETKVWHMSSAWSRVRSLTYPGIATAMADQWSVEDESFSRVAALA